MKKQLLALTSFVLVLSSCQYLGLNSSKLELIPYMAGDKWGYLDDGGKIAINPQFNRANVFIDGVALVASADNKYGFIGTDGKYKINPSYKAAGFFSEGLACVVAEDGKPQFIDEKGEVKLTVNEGRYCGIFSEGLALVGVEGKEGIKWGYMNKEGSMVINPQFDAAGVFKEGMASVAQTNKDNGETLWGFIDTKGSLVINHQFKGGAATFSNGLAMVSDGKKIGYVDKQGKYVINPQFDQAGEFKNGMAPFRQGDMGGYIDKEGKIIINPQFNGVQPFSGSLAAVSSSDGKYGYIDKDGKYVINPQFERASDFFGNVAFVRSADKWGLIDNKGKYLVNPQFDALNFDTEGYRSSLVESDYFDVASVGRSFLEGTDGRSFRNLTNATNVGQLKTSFSDLVVSEYDWSAYSNQTVQLNDNSYITRVQFVFSESPSAGKQPVYRTQQTYDYWRKGYVDKEVLDHYENIPNDNALLHSVAFRVELTGNKAQAKAEKIFKAIQEEIASKMGVQASGNVVENENMQVVFKSNGSVASYEITFDPGKESVEY